MIRTTIELSAETSDDGWGDNNYCGVELKLVDGAEKTLAVRLTRATDVLYLDLTELRRSLAILEAENG